jgi:hypothetical protein
VLAGFAAWHAVVELEIAVELDEDLNHINREGLGRTEAWALLWLGVAQTLDGLARGAALVVALLGAGRAGPAVEVEAAEAKLAAGADGHATPVEAARLLWVAVVLRVAWARERRSTDEGLHTN